MAKEDDIAVTAWGLIGGGVLTGKYRDLDAMKRYESAPDAALQIGDAVVALAKEIGKSPAQVAINWVRQQGKQAQIIPIIGARTLEQIEDNLGVLDFELEKEQLDCLASLSGFQLGFPRSFLTGENVQRLIHGKTYEKIYTHRV